MKRGTALVLSTYPIKNPRHGGQLRSAALMKEYKRAYSKVIRTAVFNSSVYSKNEFGRNDIPSPPELTQQIISQPELEAWFLGESPISNSEVRIRLESLLSKHHPDVIIYEQPFLFMGVDVLLAELKLKIPVIYSSHNVEAQLMQEIFSSMGTLDKFSRQIVKLSEVEEALTGLALGVIAVSPQDASVFESLGSKNVIVQGNGANSIRRSWLKRLRVRRVMKSLGVNRYALYVGSSHRPNIDGFIDMLGTRLGYLPSDSMIFLAGDISQGLHPEIRRVDPAWGDLAWGRIFSWNRVSERTLSALISEATCIVLPLTSGGGSNLKTAEALLAGKQIIATSTALRSFEQFAPSSPTFISDDPKIFQELLVKCMTGTTVGTEVSEKLIQPRVTWEEQMGLLQNWFKRINGNVK